MTETLDLKPGPLARPMDKSAMGNDAAALRALCGVLNSPELTGADLPPEEKADNDRILAGVAAAIPAGQPMLPPPAPKAPPANRTLTEVLQKAAPPKRVTLPAGGEVVGTKNETLVSGIPTLFFTGNAKAGKSFLAAQIGARVLEFDDPIFVMASTAFGPVQELGALRQFVAEVRAWGNGEAAPLTPARALFTVHVRSSGNDGLALFGIDPIQFGTPGFWVRSLLARCGRPSAEARPIVVTDVSTVEQYQGLRKAGFSPYHVMCNAITRSARGGGAVTQQLADSIERDITMQVSQAGSGQKFWAVWSDEKYPAPSSRLLSVQEFVQRING